MTRRLEVDVDGLAIGGFYDDMVGGDTPSNWIAVEQEEVCLGWTWDFVALLWVAPIELLVPIEDVRDTRNSLLAGCDHITQRHIEQVSLGLTTTLTDVEYMQWLTYRQELRDMVNDYVPVVTPVYPEDPSQTEVI
jgi:hypothetical protein